MKHMDNDAYVLCDVYKYVDMMTVYIRGGETLRELILCFGETAMASNFQKLLYLKF